MSANFVHFCCTCCKEEKTVTSYHRLNFDTFEERDMLEKMYDLKQYWIYCAEKKNISWMMGNLPEITKDQSYGKVDGCYSGLYIVNKPYQPGDWLCMNCIRRLEEENILTHIWTH